MVILLSLEESDEQILAGIPEIVTLTTNVPATIFFTLDDTDPTEDSEIYVDEIIMPTDSSTVILKAIAISGDSESSILEVTYFPDQSNITKSRLTGKEGINILPPDEDVVDNISVDENSSNTQTTSIPFEDLDIKASTTNHRGERISGNTSISFINLATRTVSVAPTAISSTAAGEIFDPLSSLILIDGSTDEKFENQTIRIINRSMRSMDLVSKVYNSSLSSQQLISSHLVTAIKNPDTGLMVFYYRDSRENRWIKSTQQVESTRLNISNSSSPISGFVFRWIEDRSQTRIF